MLITLINKHRPFGFYNELKTEETPKATFREIAHNRNLNSQNKLEGMLKRVKETGAKPTAKDVKNLNLSGVKVTKKMNLALLGEDALREIEFTGAQIDGQKFKKMNLRNMKLQGATITNTQFVRCSLENANLEGATCGKASFKNTDMTGANLENMKTVSNVDMKNTATAGVAAGGAKLDFARKMDVHPMRHHGTVLSQEQRAVLKQCETAYADDYNLKVARPEPPRKKHQFPQLNVA